jgi:hypothetical protein
MHSSSNENDRLDSTANATFDVLNAKEARTADMGGMYLTLSSFGVAHGYSFVGAATTSDFTAAVIQHL